MSTTRRVGRAPGMMPRLKALAGQALASVREARRPKPSRRHPDDEWYTDDWRKQEINERQRDERSWLRRPGPGWLTRRERPWW